MGVRLSHLFLALRIFSEMDLSRLKRSATIGHLFSLTTALGHFSLTQVQKLSEVFFACSRAV